MIVTIKIFKLLIKIMIDQIDFVISNALKFECFEIDIIFFFRLYIIGELNSQYKINIKFCFIVFALFEENS